MSDINVSILYIESPLFIRFVCYVVVLHGCILTHNVSVTFVFLFLDPFLYFWVTHFCLLFFT